MQKLGQSEFTLNFNGDPDAFIDIIPDMIDQGLFAMGDVMQVEQLVMSQFYKKTDAVKTIEAANPTTDEHILKVKERIRKAMQPFGTQQLEAYRKMIVPYLKPLYLDVAQIIAEKDDEDNPATVNLRRETNGSKN